MTTRTRLVYQREATSTTLRSNIGVQCCETGSVARPVPSIEWEIMLRQFANYENAVFNDPFEDELSVEVVAVCRELCHT